MEFVVSPFVCFARWYSSVRDYYRYENRERREFEFPASRVAMVLDNEQYSLFSSVFFFSTYPQFHLKVISTNTLFNRYPDVQVGRQVQMSAIVSMVRHEFSNTQGEDTQLWLPHCELVWDLPPDYMLDRRFTVINYGYDPQLLGKREMVYQVQVRNGVLVRYESPFRLLRLKSRES